jgi:hypothetical protein
VSICSTVDKWLIFQGAPAGTPGRPFLCAVIADEGVRDARSGGFSLDNWRRTGVQAATRRAHAAAMRPHEEGRFVH